MTAKQFTDLTGRTFTIGGGGSGAGGAIYPNGPHPLDNPALVKPTTGRYALIAGVSPRAVRGDDAAALQVTADRMQGASVTVRFVDGTEHVIGVVDYTRVERV